MALQSCSAATFAYDFTGGTSIGLSGTIPLSRVGPGAPGLYIMKLPRDSVELVLSLIIEHPGR